MLTLPKDDANVYDVLEKAFEDLMELCTVVLDKFNSARDEFNENQMS